MRGTDALPHTLPRELILHEKWLMQKEWMRQATYIRLSLIGVCMGMGALDAIADVFPASWKVLIGFNSLALAANGLAIWLQRRDRARPWHMWALLFTDSAIIAVLGSAMGMLGYFSMPFYLLASVAYSLTIPRAARVQLLVALVFYPIARGFGTWQAGHVVPYALIAVEELIMGAIGYLAIAGPMRFTYRVRGARRALGALARGDFSVRLPARALDDLGFLAVSFNHTAERLGQTVERLEAEVAERTKAEDALRASQEALSHQAFHDPLTGLCNRSRFRQLVADTLANGSPESTAVLAVDLDGFKTVNDTYGHAAGDLLLVEVGSRLQQATRGSDMVARLGGDEFAVLLRYLRDESEAIVVADRILKSLDTPIVLGDRSASVGASIGIARGLARNSESGDPADAAEADGRPALSPVDSLLHDADVALYHGKTRGKGRWTRFDPSMHNAAAERRTLQGELRLAMANGDLEVYYQPMIDLASGRVAGFEALLRWTHPTRGPIPPSVFIPVAEESGLIVPLGRWTLQTACEQLATWHRDVMVPPGTERFFMTVNVSGRQLHHSGFVEDVIHVLDQSGVPPHSLILELTESSVIHRSHSAKERMWSLRNSGVRLAIDDFGTGYSSLSYLQQFPIDMIKIDRSFVEGVLHGGPQEALVRTIILLGHALSLRTVAEGIETEPQRECLRAMGCELGQGFFFARPMTADAAAALLAVHFADVLNA
ncbi:MAG: EAL domain-containing protein [Gemmatimonadaceae bacterium]